MAPETMVAAVAAKTAWNIQKASTHGSLPGAKSLRKKPDVPNQPVEVVPNMSPNPMAQKVMEPMEKSMRFFIKMFTAFLARVNPASTMANPTCMKKTSAAAIRVQR
jgi:hypothetical protein